MPREAAENLLRGREDLKNLGYESNKERLSFAKNYDLKNHIYSEYLTPSEKLDKNIKAISTTMDIYVDATEDFKIEQMGEFEKAMKFIF